MEQEVSEKFKCPICFEIPEKEVFQCRNGHTVCFGCGESLSQCPQCRVQLDSPKIRCRALEDLLDMMSFDCINKSLGCTSKFKRQEIQNHSKNCTYGVKMVKLCEHLGYSCGYAINTQLLEQAITHFKATHDFIVCRNSNINISLEGFESASSRRNSMWTPVTIDMSLEYGKLFVLLSLINGDDHSLSFVCLDISEKLERYIATDEYRAGFKIDAIDSDGKPHVNWNVSPLQAKHIATEINEAIHRFPLSLLRKHYSRDGVLIVKCSIQNNARPLPSLQIQDPEFVQALNISRNSAHSEANSIRVSRRGSQTPSSMSSSTRQVDSHSITSSNLVSEIFALAVSQTTLSADIIFATVTCKKCLKRPIKRFRFKCLECRDYDLCMSCYETGKHSRHIFVVVVNSEQNRTLETRWTQALQTTHFVSLGMAFLTAADPSLARNSSYFKCTHCSNERKKYVCLDCCSLVGYCKPCFRIQLRVGTHVHSHCFAVTETTDKLEFVILRIMKGDFNPDKTMWIFASGLVVNNAHNM